MLKKTLCFDNKFALCNNFLKHAKEEVILENKDIENVFLFIYIYIYVRRIYDAKKKRKGIFSLFVY